MHKQTIEFAYLGGAVSADRELSVEKTRRSESLGVHPRYKTEIYDSLDVRLRLKVRVLNVDVVEPLLYGCVTWSPNKPDYDRPRQVHHSMLRRCLGWRKRDDYTLSYANALAKTDSEGAETEDIVRGVRESCGGGVSAAGGDVWGAG